MAKRERPGGKAGIVPLLLMTVLSLGALAAALSLGRQLKMARAELERHAREPSPRARATELQADLASKSKELDELQRKLNEALVANQSVAAKLKLAQAANMPQHDLVNQLNAQNQKLARQISDAQAAADELRRRLEQVTGDLQGQLAKVRAERDGLEQNLPVLTASLADARNSSQQLHKSRTDLEEKLAGAQQQVAATQRDMAALRKTYESYREETEQRIVQLNEQIATLRSEKTVLEERLRDLAKDKEEGPRAKP